MADKPSLSPVTLECRCGAMNIPHASETIEVINGKAVCNTCGRDWNWPPKRSEGV